MQHGFLSEAEGKAVDQKRVSAFFQSALARRMLQSETLLREYKFTFFLPAGECDEGLPAEVANEQVLVQGIADCVFVENGRLVIVDYKTDRVSCAEELADKYREQLRIYRLILQQSLQTPVKSCILYSFYLEREIELEFPDEDKAGLRGEVNA